MVLHFGLKFSINDFLCLHYFVDKIIIAALMQLPEFSDQDRLPTLWLIEIVSRTESCYIYNSADLISDRTARTATYQPS